jgi:hypothetical protein
MRTYDPVRSIAVDFQTTVQRNTAKKEVFVFGKFEPRLTNLVLARQSSGFSKSILDISFFRRSLFFSLHLLKAFNITVVSFPKG